MLADSCTRCSSWWSHESLQSVDVTIHSDVPRMLSTKKPVSDNKSQSYTTTLATSSRETYSPEIMCELVSYSSIQHSILHRVSCLCKSRRALGHEHYDINERNAPCTVKYSGDTAVALTISASAFVPSSFVLIFSNVQQGSNTFASELTIAPTVA